MAIKIYTKTGDKGETGLYGGKRVAKDDLRIEAYGTIDELNAVLGGLGDVVADRQICDFIRLIQSDLFVIGAHLAKDPAKDLVLPQLPGSRISEMETTIDFWENHLSPLKNFILPGGHTTVSNAHIARCICRRAERRTVTLSKSDAVDPVIIQYLNRLSDYLFVLSRELAKQLHVEEIKWLPE